MPLTARVTRDVTARATRDVTTEPKTSCLLAVRLRKGWSSQQGRAESGARVARFFLFGCTVFLKFSVCSTKQQQTLLYCMNHFDTKNWLIYVLKQDKNAQTALWSLCHSCPTTWGKIGTSAPGSTLAPFSVKLVVEHFFASFASCLGLIDICISYLGPKLIS